MQKERKDCWPSSVCTAQWVILKVQWLSGWLCIRKLSVQLRVNPAKQLLFVKLYCFSPIFSSQTISKLKSETLKFWGTRESEISQIYPYLLGNRTRSFFVRKPSHPASLPSFLPLKHTIWTSLPRHENSNKAAVVGCCERQEEPLYLNTEEWTNFPNCK